MSPICEQQLPYSISKNVLFGSQILFYSLTINHMSLDYNIHPTQLQYFCKRRWNYKSTYILSTVHMAN
jgi:hypothetical protein